MNVRHELAPLTNTAVVVVSVCYGVAHAFLAPLGLVGAVLRGVLWLSTWRYAYTVLYRIAQGHHELETPDAAALNPLARIPLVVHFVLLPVVIGVLIGTEAVPALVRWPAVVLLVAAMPASAALMAVTDNFAIALSPWHVARVIGRLGRGYLKLLGFCALLAIALAALYALPWPAGLGTIIVSTADVWACLGAFALTGALIREHRAELGIPGEIEPVEERAARDRRRAWQAALDKAYACFSRGLPREGRAAIDALIESEGASLAVHQWLFDSMVRWESQSPALVVGKPYVELLMQAGQAHEALDLFARCRRISARFAITPEASGRLAEYARSIGREALADDLETTPGPAAEPR